MASQDFSRSGAFNVDGQWVTAIRYELSGSDQVQLRFMNGGAEVAQTQLGLDGARELLGNANHAAILRAHEKGKTTGTLRGRALEFRRVVLPESATPAAENELAAETPRGSTRADTPTKRDAVAQAAGRFMRKGQRFYFPDRTLAFIDRGSRLKAVSENPVVVATLVAIATARGWQAVRVSGTREFRSALWREATAHGIEVRGYEPTLLDRAALQREAGVDPVAQATGSSGGKGASSTPATNASNRLTGRLLEAGAAHYRFDPNAGQSYYVRVATDQGERVLWGTDLERALVESRSGVRVGDMVAIEHRGAQAVSVVVPQRDGAGELVGDRRIATHRNSWVIETPAWFEHQAAKAKAFATAAGGQELVRQHPDLTHAVVSLWLGEQFAAQRFERTEDRERVIQFVKERLTQALARGDRIDAPRLRRDVARELDAIARREHVRGVDEARLQRAGRSAHEPEVPSAARA